MFESIITNIISKYVGEYIENINPKDFGFSLASGKVNVQNLRLKPGALDSLGLPVEITMSHVGTLNVSIPWTSLKSNPVVITLQDVYIMMHPLKVLPWDNEREKQRKETMKKYKLQQFENTWKQKQEQELEEQVKEKPKSKGLFASFQSFFSDTLGTKQLTEAIINNIQVTVKNVQVRYEDYSDHKNPFTFGISLEEFRLFSTDTNWNPVFVQGTQPVAYKQAQLQQLQIYSLKDCISLTSSLDIKEIFASQTLRQNILQPWNATLKMAIQQGQPLDLSKPRIHAELAIGDVNALITDIQFRYIVDTATYFINYDAEQDYRQFRPRGMDFKTKEDRLKWISYLKQSLEAKARNKFTNVEVFAHRNQILHDYTHLYEQFALNGKQSSLEAQQMSSIESELSLQDILLLRKLIRQKLSSTSTVSSIPPPPPQNKTTLTEQEKKELASSLELEEQQLDAPLAPVPEFFVELHLVLNIKLIEVALQLESTNQPFLKSRLVNCYDQISIKEDTSFRNRLQVQNLEVLHWNNNSYTKMIAPLAQQESNLLLDSIVDVTSNRIGVEMNLEQLQIIPNPFHLQTLLYFLLGQFQNINSQSIQQVSTQTWDMYSSTIQQQTMLLAQNRKFLDLHLQCKAPQVILYCGVNTQQAIYINLGDVSITSEQAPASLQEEERDVSKLFYDKYTIALEELQICLTTIDDPSQPIVNEQMKSALLLPVNAKVELYRSFTDQYKDLPSFNIQSSLSKLDTTLDMSQDMLPLVSTVNYFLPLINDPLGKVHFIPSLYHFTCQFQGKHYYASVKSDATIMLFEDSNSTILRHLIPLQQTTFSKEMNQIRIDRQTQQPILILEIENVDEMETILLNMRNSKAEAMRTSSQQQLYYNETEMQTQETILWQGQFVVEGWSVQVTNQQVPLFQFIIYTLTLQYQSLSNSTSHVSIECRQIGLYSIKDASLMKPFLDWNAEHTMTLEIVLQKETTLVNLHAPPIGIHLDTLLINDIMTCTNILIETAQQLGTFSQTHSVVNEDTNTAAITFQCELPELTIIVKDKGYEFIRCVLQAVKLHWDQFVNQSQQFSCTLNSFEVSHWVRKQHVPLIVSINAPCLSIECKYNPINQQWTLTWQMDIIQLKYIQKIMFQLLNLVQSMAIEVMNSYQVKSTSNTVSTTTPTNTSFVCQGDFKGMHILFPYSVEELILQPKDSKIQLQIHLMHFQLQSKSDTVDFDFTVSQMQCIDDRQSVFFECKQAFSVSKQNQKYNIVLSELDAQIDRYQLQQLQSLVQQNLLDFSLETDANLWKTSTAPKDTATPTTAQMELDITIKGLHLKLKASENSVLELQWGGAHCSYSSSLKIVINNMQIFLQNANRTIPILQRSNNGDDASELVVIEWHQEHADALNINHLQVDIASYQSTICPSLFAFFSSMLQKDTISHQQHLEIKEDVIYLSPSEYGSLPEQITITNPHVYLMEDMTLHSACQMVIASSANDSSLVTIDGQGHTLTFESSANSQPIFHIAEDRQVLFKNITLKMEDETVFDRPARVFMPTSKHVTIITPQKKIIESDTKKQETSPSPNWLVQCQMGHFAVHVALEEEEQKEKLIMQWNSHLAYQYMNGKEMLSFTVQDGNLLLQNRGSNIPMINNPLSFTLEQTSQKTSETDTQRTIRFAMTDQQQNIQIILSMQTILLLQHYATALQTSTADSKVENREVEFQQRVQEAFGLLKNKPPPTPKVKIHSATTSQTTQTISLFVSKPLQLEVLLMDYSAQQQVGYPLIKLSCSQLQVSNATCQLINTTQVKELQWQSHGTIGLEWFNKSAWEPVLEPCSCQLLLSSKEHETTSNMTTEMQFICGNPFVRLNISNSMIKSLVRFNTDASKFSNMNTTVLLIQNHTGRNIQLGKQRSIAPYETINMSTIDFISQPQQIMPIQVEQFGQFSLGLKQQYSPIINNQQLICCVQRRKSGILIFGNICLENVTDFDISVKAGNIIYSIKPKQQMGLPINFHEQNLQLTTGINNEKSKWSSVSLSMLQQGKWLLASLPDDRNIILHRQMTSDSHICHIRFIPPLILENQLASDLKWELKQSQTSSNGIIAKGKLVSVYNIASVTESISCSLTLNQNTCKQWISISASTPQQVIPFAQESIHMDVATDVIDAYQHVIFYSDYCIQNDTDMNLVLCDATPQRNPLLSLPPQTTQHLSLVNSSLSTVLSSALYSQGLGIPLPLQPQQPQPIDMEYPPLEYQPNQLASVTVTSQAIPTSRSTLLRIAPKFVLYNATDMELEFYNIDTQTHSVVQPKQELIFHASKMDNRFCFKKQNSKSTVFQLKHGNQVIKLVDPQEQIHQQLLEMDCQRTKGSWKLTVSTTSIPPILLWNDIPNLSITVSQVPCQWYWDIAPHEQLSYTWDSLLEDEFKFQLQFGNETLKRNLAWNDKWKDFQVLELQDKSERIVIQTQSVGRTMVIRFCTYSSYVALNKQIKKEEEEQIQFGAKLQIPICQVSMIWMSQEIALFQLQGVELLFEQSQLNQYLQVNMQQMQFDNQSTNPQFVHILESPTTNRHVMQLSLTRKRNHSNWNTILIPYFALALQEIHLNVEYEFYLLFALFCKDIISYAMKSKSDGSQKVESTESNSSTELALEEFVIHPIKVVVTLNLKRPTSSKLLDDPMVQQLTHQNPIIQHLLRIPTSWIKFSDAKLQLPALQITHMHKPLSQFTSLLQQHYTRALLMQSYKIIGALDVIGNPINLFSDMGTGVKEFFYEPLQAVVKGPEELAHGVLKGTTSLFKNTLLRPLGSASHIANTLVNTMSFDLNNTPFQDKVEFPANPVKEVVKGGQKLLHGILHTMKLAPSSSEEKSSTSIQNLISTGEDGSILLQHQKLQDQSQRIRLPREFGPHGQVVPFNQNISVIRYLLNHNDSLSNQLILHYLIAYENSKLSNVKLYIITNQYILCIGNLKELRNRGVMMPEWICPKQNLLKTELFENNKELRLTVKSQRADGLQQVSMFHPSKEELIEFKSKLEDRSLDSLA